MKVYLDGQAVDVGVIDPSKHTFIGTFRPPMPPQEAIVGQNIYHASMNDVQLRQFWREGYFDLPQYRSFNDR